MLAENAAVMDHQLLESSLLRHGTFLLNELKAEQQVTVDGRLTSYLSTILPHSDEPRDECDRRLVKFIAKKADLLFAVTDEQSIWKPDVSKNRTRYCAVLPPVEYFMQVSRTVCREQFYHSVDKGDIVVGSVTSLHDIGLTLTLLAVDVGMARDIDELKITAFCPLREIPKSHPHEDALASFSIKSKIRAIVLSVIDEKITVSLQPRALPADSDVKLGVITDEEMPAYYRSLATVEGRSYGMLLREAPEFRNPSDVNNMAAIFGLDGVKCQPSLMRGLYRVKYNEADYADRLRKAQSRRLAMRSVAEGVEHFKNDRLPEAMQMFNKALQIDNDNVDALVARGALYANSESYRRALEDFDAALAVNPEHTNARKYACDTLLALARGQLESGDVDVAISHVYRASLLYPNNTETVSLLAEIQRRKAAEIAAEMLNCSGAAGDGPDTVPTHVRGPASKSKHGELGGSPTTEKTKKRPHSPAAKSRSRASGAARKRQSSSSSSCSSSSSSSSSSSGSSSSTSSSSSSSSEPTPNVEVMWVPAPSVDDKKTLSQLVGCRTNFGDHRGYDDSLVNPERQQGTVSEDASGDHAFGPSLPPPDDNDNSKKTSPDRKRSRSRNGSGSSPPSPKRHRSFSSSSDGRRKRAGKKADGRTSNRRQSSEQRKQMSSIDRRRRRSASTGSSIASDGEKRRRENKNSRLSKDGRSRNRDGTGQQSAVRSGKKRSRSSDTSSSRDQSRERHGREKNSVKRRNSSNANGRDGKNKKHTASGLKSGKKDLARRDSLSKNTGKSIKAASKAVSSKRLSFGGNPREGGNSVRRFSLGSSAKDSGHNKEMVKDVTAAAVVKKKLSPSKSAIVAGSDDADKNLQPKPADGDGKPKETLEEFELFLRQLKANKQATVQKK